MDDINLTVLEHAVKAAGYAGTIELRHAETLQGKKGGSRMKCHSIAPSALAAMVLAGTLWSGAAYGQPVGAGDLPSMVANAKTATDHEAIAKRYDQLAASEKGEAGEHKNLAASYRGMTSGVVGKQHLESLAKHCDTLAKDANASATEYEALAAGHRQLAKMAK